MPGKIAKEREKYVIRLSNCEMCEVSREVYLCWYAGDRQERYQMERDRMNGVFSMDAMSEKLFHEDSCSLEEVIPADEESVEDKVTRKIMTEKLRLAMRKLDPDAMELITALYFENVSLRSYAARKGVTHRAVQKWRDAVLKDLRRLIELS